MTIILCSLSSSCTVISGSIASTVTVYESEASQLPTASVAVAVIVIEPSPKSLVVILQFPSAFAEPDPISVVPLYNLTVELASAVPSIVGVAVVWYWAFVLITSFSGSFESL